MECDKCREKFDIERKKPFILPCCGGLVCQVCIDSLSKQNGGDKITCFECNKQIRKDTIIQNKTIQQLLKNPKFYSNDGDKNKASSTFNTLLIQVILILIAVLGSYVYTAVSEMRLQLQSQNNLLENLTKTQDHKSFETQFQQVNEKIEQAFGRLSQQLNSLNKQGDDSQLKELEKFTEIQKEEAGQGGFKKIDDNHGMQNAVDSLLIQTQQEMQFIHSAFSTSKFRLELLYRGSKDGFSGRDFHRLCNNQGKTLTVIKSEHGKIFGGFTSLAWESPQYWGQRSDPEAFLFSLTERTKHPQFQNHDSAITHSANTGPVFGLGRDIYISQNPNIKGDSFANLGGTYKLPDGIGYESHEATTYLAGSFKFKVSEIEVFKVTFF